MQYARIACSIGVACVLAAPPVRAEGSATAAPARESKEAPTAPAQLPVVPTDAPPAGGAHTLTGVAIGIAVPTAILGTGMVIWWHRKAPSFNPDDFGFRDRGWLGRDTYAGGHDKVGHLAANYFSQMAVTALYEAAGYDRRAAILYAGLVTLVSYNLVELFDAYTPYGWEYGDSVFNVIGQAMAIATQLWGLESYVQLRLGWLPSDAYLETERRKIRFLEDYSGQRFYLLANTDGISQSLGFDVGPARYLAAGLYYETRGYRPRWPAGSGHSTEARQRNLGVTLVLDAAALITHLVPDSTPTRAAATALRYYQVPAALGYGFDFNHDSAHAADLRSSF